MLKSLTAKVTGSFKVDEFVFYYEIYSLNAKGLNFKISLPFFLEKLELDIRKIIYNILKRGTIVLKIKVAPSFYRKILVEKLKILKEEIDEYYFEFNKLFVDKDLMKPDWFSFLKNLNFFFLEEEKLLEEELFLNEIEKVVKRLDEERKVEGEHLLNIIEDKVKQLKVIAEKIEKKKGNIFNENISKIKEYLKQLSIEEINVDINKILDKVNFVEEIDRINVHLKNLDNLLKNNEIEEKGRKINFFAQELLREFNTLANKVLRSDISLLVIEAKDIITSLKEQSANIL